MSSQGENVRRVRRRTLLRWPTAGMAVLALAASLMTVIRRGEHGRRLMAELRAVEAEAGIVMDRMDAARARVDSLAAPSRIERAAGALGLQRAGEEQLLRIGAGYPPDGEGIEIPGRGGDR